TLSSNRIALVTTVTGPSRSPAAGSIVVPELSSPMPQPAATRQALAAKNRDRCAVVIVILLARPPAQTRYQGICRDLRGEAAATLDNLFRHARPTLNDLSKQAEE